MPDRKLLVRLALGLGLGVALAFVAPAVLGAMGGPPVGCASTPEGCVDTTAPRINIRSPLAGQVVERNEVVEAGYFCLDEHGGSRVASCTGTVPNGSSIDTATSGTKSFTVVAVDHAGNRRTRTVTYTVTDGVAPTITIASPVDGSVVPRGAVVNAAYSCVDDPGGSGIASCTGTRPSGQPISTSTTGTKTFTVTARDRSGNTATRTVTYRVSDPTPPTISISQPVDGRDYDRNDEVTARFECRDESGGSGLDTCEGTVADGERIDTSEFRTYSFTVTATDNSGNSASQTVTYRVTDDTKPMIGITRPGPYWNVFDRGEVVTARYGCADEVDGSGLASCEGTVANDEPLDTSTSGTKTFTVTARDNAGNTRTQTVTYKVRDEIKPTVVIRAPNPTGGSSLPLGARIEADYECADEEGGTGITSCVGTVPDGQPVNTSAPGLYSFKVTARDGDNNQTTVSRLYQVRDMTPPEVDLRTPADGEVVAQGSVVLADFDCSDPVGGTENMQVCRGTEDDGQPIATSTQGLRQFTVRAVDGVSNVTTVQHLYRVVDMTPPTVTTRTPVDGGYVELGSDVRADYECVDNFAGSQVAQCVGTVPDGSPIDTLTPGDHQFAVFTRDNNGNQQTTTVTYTVVLEIPDDETPPTVAFTTPTDGQELVRGSTVVADYACADEGGAGLWRCDGDLADGAPIDTSTLGAGSLTVTARDRVGNETTETVAYTVVDGTAPTATISLPVNGAVVARGAVTYADYSCTDEAGGSGLASCTGDVADGAALDTSTLGSHPFTVVARDAAGNEGTATARYTVIDTVDPTITVTVPAEGAELVRGSVVAADFSCADEAGGSGVASCVGDPVVATDALGPHSYTVTATDRAGNEAIEVVAYTVVDGADPTVAITAPTDGAEVERDGVLLADFSCADEAGGSGVASCTGDVRDGQPVDTSTPGPHTFTVTAVDRAGNETTAEVGYVVTVHQPDVRLGGARRTTANTVRAGRSLSFVVQVANAGNVPDRFTLRAQGTAKGLAVSFRGGGRNVRTVELAPDGRATFRLTVQAGPRVPVGRVLNLTLTGRSVDHPAATDVLHLRVRVVR